MSSFTTGELEVMKILWEHRELKPSQIQAKYSRRIKNAALRFQLKILLEKGHVARRRIGRAYYYKALTARQGAFKRMARRMARVYCQGSAAGLIAELIKTEKLTPDEIQQLRQLAEAKSSEKTLKKKGGKKT
ncbi:MAG TPA: BlaI/MecI/CopY family transcriptional regulator [Sedimentisphaerales bacterium]|nr:BlaI/MecI/CopY family transcriptional regulator [Sedimentisphaerales bacterium]